MADLGDYEVDLRNCIFKECKGDLIELEAFNSITWITIVYRCTKCGEEFTMKIET